MKPIRVFVPLSLCMILFIFSLDALAAPVAGDIDLSGSIDAVDVQLAINGALGVSVAESTDIDYNLLTNAIDVQLVINAALGVAIDADNDGLCDAAEANIGTDQGLFDTDGDGVGDGQEMPVGADPLIGSRFTEEIVALVERGEINLNPAATEVPPQTASGKMFGNPERVQVDGYDDHPVTGVT